MSTVQNLNESLISPEIKRFSGTDRKQTGFYTENPFQLSAGFEISKQKPVQYFVKRVIEIICTFIGLVFLLPILVSIAAAIKLDSEGPVFFKQKRTGKYGKEFYMYKFRSMENDAEEKVPESKKHNQTNKLMFKMFDDPRITKPGKFLRKHSLDELPQLFNVLKGEMSLVGYRPPLPSEVAKYQKRHYVRFAAMPGLTGPWQVGGRSNVKNFEDVINLEYKYIKNWSLFKDFQILFKTIPVVLTGKDAA